MKRWKFRNRAVRGRKRCVLVSVFQEPAESSPAISETLVSSSFQQHSLLLDCGQRAHVRQSPPLETFPDLWALTSTHTLPTTDEANLLAAFDPHKPTLVLSSFLLRRVLKRPLLYGTCDRTNGPLFILTHAFIYRTAPRSLLSNIPWENVSHQSSFFGV